MNKLIKQTVKFKKFFTSTHKFPKKALTQWVILAKPIVTLSLNSQPHQGSRHDQFRLHLTDSVGELSCHAPGAECSPYPAN
jgi:hypothetical protein